MKRFFTHSDKALPDVRPLHAGDYQQNNTLIAIKLYHPIYISTNCYS